MSDFNKCFDSHAKICSLGFSVWTTLVFGQVIFLYFPAKYCALIDGDFGSSGFQTIPDLMDFIAQ